MDQLKRQSEDVLSRYSPTARLPSPAAPVLMSPIPGTQSRQVVCLDGAFAFYRTRTASEGLQKAASASAEAARATSERLRQQASQVLAPLCTLLVGPPCCRLHQLHLTNSILSLPAEATAA